LGDDPYSGLRPGEPPNLAGSSYFFTMKIKHQVKMKQFGHALERLSRWSDYCGSCTLILQSSFHIRLVSLAAFTQGLITLGSASSPELSEQPEQSLSSP
jgi:hypothetical protein